MSDDKFIDSPPAGAAGWDEVWREDRRYPPTGGSIRRFARRLYLLFSGASGEARRQREFNVVLLELMGDLRLELTAIRDDFRKQADEILSDLRRVNADLARDIAEVDTRIHTAVRRGDALVAAVDRKIEGLSARTRDLTNPPVASAAPSPRPAPDFVYRRMEDALRGSEAEVRESARHYIQYAREKGSLIDVGCGRGELLELCFEEGIDAIGFDSNERVVADLVERGLDARIGMVPECLTELEADSIGTVVAMHVVEHLPFAQLLSLFTESARVLSAGGFLVIETPNADSLVSSASELWKDPTHLAPRHQAALVTIARELGFEVAELATTDPFHPDEMLPVPDDSSDSARELVERLNRMLYGDRNLRLVLKKA